VLFSLLLAGLTVLALACWRILHPAIMMGGGMRLPFDPFVNAALFVGTLCVYWYCYALTAVLIRRLFPRQIKTEFTWGIVLLLLGVGMTVPPLFAFLLMDSGTRFANEYYWLLPNPFAAAMMVTESSFRNQADLTLGFVSCWAALVTVFNLPWFVRQLVEFRPP